MIAVIGCGRSGLPLALKLAGYDIPLIGVESDPARRAALAEGRMPFTEPGTQELLSRSLGKTFTVAAILTEAITRADVFIISVNTPLDERMLPVVDAIEDLAFSVLSLADILTNSRRRVMIIVRSTVPPGFSARLMKRIQARFNLTVGKDFHYAYCPDRCAPGRSLAELETVPQIIGTFEDESRQRVEAVFSPLRTPIVATGPTEAELAKLFNNAHRYVSFALGNECLLLADALGADAGEAFRAAAEGYGRGAPPPPGYAGGPYLYKDGFFLTWSVPGTDLLLTSWKLNEGLMDQLVRRVKGFGPITRPAVLGMGYKEGNDDTRFSPGERLVRLLAPQGVTPMVHDPNGRWPGAIDSLEEVLSNAREIFIGVPDPAYRTLSWGEVTGLLRPDAILADPWLLWGQKRPVIQMKQREAL